jgi:hypothetical protein
LEAMKMMSANFVPILVNGEWNRREKKSPDICGGRKITGTLISQTADIIWFIEI